MQVLGSSFSVFFAASCNLCDLAPEQGSPRFSSSVRHVCSRGHPSLVAPGHCYRYCDGNHLVAFSCSSSSSTKVHLALLRDDLKARQESLQCLQDELG